MDTTIATSEGPVAPADEPALAADRGFMTAVLDRSPDLSYVVDCTNGDGAPWWASGALHRLLGWTPEQLADLGEPAYRAVVHVRDLDRMRAGHVAAALLPDGAAVSIRCRVRHRDGGYRWLSAKLTPFARDDRGRVTRILGVARDITDNVAVEERLALAALHDGLTGLPNRALLADRLAAALHRHRRTGQVVPVLFCDLDGFKHVNDTSGHQAGDQVLIVTAQRLRRALRPQDTVARVGGDEFVVVLEPGPPVAPPTAGKTGTTDTGATVAGAPSALVLAETLAVADRLVAVLGEPISSGSPEGDGTDHVVTVSIGVSFAHPDSNPDEALRDADSAMYRAKARGRDRREIFDDSFRAQALERGHVEQALRAALHPSAPGRGDRTPGPDRPATGRDESVPGAHELSVVYQPVFDLTGPHLVGVEALARLTDQYGVDLPPRDFIPVAEETGMIAALGRRVLDIACDDLAAWHAAHPRWRHLGVAVNLSARQAGLVDLVADVRLTLRRTGLAPNLLTLELTESVLLDAGLSTWTALTTLTDDGVRLAIDDFGTGYASLRYLARLPVTSVKIDQSFTAGLPGDPTSATIVRTVAGLARDLGITCVVEGIETDEQLASLPAGVHGQGYLLGRPLSPGRLLAMLETPLARERDPSWPVHLRRPGPLRRRSSPTLRDRRIDLDAAADGAAATPSPTPASGPGRATVDATRRARRADLRDLAADRRDAAADDRDASFHDYQVDVDSLLSLAEHRDALAAVRDRRAGRRDSAASSREQGAAPVDPAASRDRELSAVDRLKGALDRDAGALDRADLTRPAAGDGD